VKTDPGQAHPRLSRAGRWRRSDARSAAQQFRLVPAGRRRAGPLREMQTEASGHFHRDGIPPQTIRPEFIAALRGDAGVFLCMAWAEVVRIAGQPLFQPVGDLESPRMAFRGYTWQRSLCRAAACGARRDQGRPRGDGARSSSLRNAGAGWPAAVRRRPVPLLARYDARDGNFVLVLRWCHADATFRLSPRARTRVSRSSMTRWYRRSSWDLFLSRSRASALMGLRRPAVSGA
jgi:hypothetical protein